MSDETLTMGIPLESTNMAAMANDQISLCGIEAHAMNGAC